MTLSVGIAFLVLAGALIFLARPDADGTPARFLRFNAALVLFPSLILILVGFGAAAIVSWVVR